MDDNPYEPVLACGVRQASTAKKRRAYRENPRPYLYLCALCYSSYTVLFVLEMLPWSEGLYGYSGCLILNLLCLCTVVASVAPVNAWLRVGIVVGFVWWMVLHEIAAAAISMLVYGPVAPG